MAIRNQEPLTPDHLDQLKEWAKLFSKHRNGFDELFGKVNQVLNMATRNNQSGVEPGTSVGIFATDHGLMYSCFSSNQLDRFYADPKRFRPTRALRRVNFNKVCVTNRLAIRFSHFVDLGSYEHSIGSIVLPNGQSIPVWHWQFLRDHIDPREMREQLHKGLVAATTLDLNKLRDEAIKNTVAINRFLAHTDVSEERLGKVLDEELRVKSRLLAAQIDNPSIGGFTLEDIYGCRMSAEFEIKAMSWGTSVALRMCGLELPVFKVKATAMEHFGDKHGTDFEVQRFVKSAIPAARHLLDLI